MSVEAYAGLKGLLMNCFARSQGRFKSEMDLVAGLYVNDQGGLCLGNKLLAGSDKPTAKVFVGLFDRMFHVEGLLTYDSTYVHAFRMLEECGDLIRPAISQRFKYVFVDEYQDCSNAQRRLIDLLFEGTDTIVQRIGDLDQAIYNGVNAKLGSDWKVAGSCLEIAETNRYGNEIARVVSRLRTGQTEIISQRGSTGALPVLFVYPAGSEKDVVGAFVSEIRNANLVRSGTFKAIGMFRNGSGTKITDYWDAFSDDAVSVSRYGLEHYLQEIERQMDLGRLYNVSRLVVELLALVSRRYGIRTDAQRYYTKRQVRDVINEKAGRVFGEGVLKLATAYAAGPGHASRYILTLLCELCHIIYGGDWSEKTLFRGLSDSDGAVANRRPMVLQFDDGIRIQLNTVHGVKGETHDATLYLETQHQKSSDLRRIMPLFDGKTLPNGDIYERSRRCVYVGLSRPCQLLCVAMRADTYKGHEDSFANDWKVVLM